MLLYQLYLTTKVFGICIRFSHLTQQLIQLFLSRIIVDVEPAAVSEDVPKQLCIIAELHDLSCQFSGIKYLVIRIWCRKGSTFPISFFRTFRTRWNVRFYFTETRTKRRKNSLTARTKRRIIKIRKRKTGDDTMEYQEFRSLYERLYGAYALAFLNRNNAKTEKGMPVAEDILQCYYQKIGSALDSLFR